MMKNTFFKIVRKGFQFPRTYKKRMEINQIIKNPNKLFVVKEEDKLIGLMKESLEKGNFHNVVTYHDVNSKIISQARRPEVIELLKEAENKHKNKMFDSVYPVFISNSMYLKEKYLFWSKFYYISLFAFLVFISYDWDLAKLTKFLNKWKINTLNSINSLLTEKDNEKHDDLKGLDQEANEFASLFSDEKSEFKLARNVPDRLSDVKGIDEVKEEIEEIVNMLKYPYQYEEAGAKLIRGVLLVGQPGTGKTLLARALAGESGINFIYLSASEFEQSLVGMGSLKLKKLFRQARKHSPCIIFIDEIDSLLHKGKRSGKYTTSSDRGLLNTFLNEMDGFKKREYVFVMGATNFIDNLDKAALRPGRFDKIINVPIPDTTGRKEIFDLYIKKVKLQLKEDIDTQTLSKMTPGFTGAEIANMVNHAIIAAVDKDLSFITKKDFEEARDRILLGLIKKSGFKTDKQLVYSAIHEAGHTLVCYFNKLCKESIHKVSVIPRGSSGRGKTSTLFEDREGTKEEFQTMIDMALGGVLAEEIYFGSDLKVTPGCGNDLNRASSLAKSMVKKYGMNSKDWGYMVVDDGVELDHKIGQNTRDTLDTASQRIIETSEKRVRSILQDNINQLKELAQKLCEYEELNKEEIDIILSGKNLELEQKKRRKISISSVAI